MPSTARKPFQASKMSKRMNFLRSIIDASSNSSVEGSSNNSENPDSGFQTGQSSLEEQQSSQLPATSSGRGRSRALAALLQPSKPTDGSLPLVAAMPNLAIGGRGRFLQKLLNKQLPSDASTTSKQSDSGAVSCSSSEVDPVSMQENLDESVQSTPPPSRVSETVDTFVLRESKEPEAIVRQTGTSGTSVQMMSNFMELKCEKNRGVFVYTVDFEPTVDSKRARQQCVDSHRNIFGKAYTFDGTILLLPMELAHKKTVLDVRTPTDETPVKMTVLFRVQQRMHQNVMIYNKIFRRIMYILQLSEMGRKHYDPTQARIVPQHKLEIWPGFVTAVDEFDGGLMLNLDVTHRVLMQTTVYTHIKTIAQCRDAQFQENVLKSLLGAVVLTRYNKKTYRIDDVLFDLNPLCTFVYGDREITYVEYYKKQYGIEIHDHQQPLLVNRTERKVANREKPLEIQLCLVPELCYLTGLTDEMRKDYKVMRDIATYTRITPNQRLQAMQKFCENVNKNDAARDLLASWGLELKTTPLLMKGRQLQSENIMSGGGTTFSAGPNVDFTRQVTNNPMLEIVHIRQWILMYTQRDERVANVFMDCVKRSCKLLGVEIAQPQIEILPQDSTQLYVQALRTRIRAGTQIVVIICPTSRDDRYAAIKRVLCTEIPIPSQIINARTLANDKRNRSIVLKIMLQMNCKLGGTLWSVNIPLKETMICGMDSYHEGTTRSNSVSAFVGSLDPSFTHWYSRATIQERKEELLNGICVSLEKTLQAYRRRNCTLPQKIIIFRDGISESMLEVCDQYEIPQLEAACQKLAPDYKPKISFIIVQKRIITRLFSMGGGAPDGIGNAPPGSVLDHTVTRRNRFDYYLVAQTVQMGTVTPTHYIVLRDDSHFSPDVLQRLSYKMCYMYYNWTGTIRVPACCQYAHKLAYLVGQSVKRMPAETLNDKLKGLKCSVMANRIVLVCGLLLIVATAVSARLVAPPRRAQIVGGFPIDISDAPFQISLRENGHHTCGGSIISPNWILTAAHCLEGVSGSTVSIRAGSTYKQHGGIIRNAKRIVLHPDWDTSTYEADCALIELEDPLPLNGQTIASIEMPEQDEEDPAEGSKAMVSGWGKTLNVYHSSLVLRATFLPIVHRDNCQKAYRRTNTISQRMLCAGFFHGGHDSCQGDSGGPLVVDDLLVGVVSFAIGCAKPGLPGVNVRVSAVRDWIREVSDV
uniref:trypsin n=1 Tax=Anopheles minimus TaxID=112268 RepID=A0A182VU77_9DIPT